MNYGKTLTALVAAGLATGAIAQEKRGVLSPIPSGVVYGTGGLQGEQGVPMVREAGAPTTLMHFEPTANGDAPIYTRDEMFGAAEHLVKIDAMSTGNDLLPVDPTTGRVVVNNLWAMLAVSVARDANGQFGSVIANAQGSVAGPGAEIIGYYFENSVPIPSTMWGETYLEQSGTDVTNATAGEQDVVAFDAFMALIEDFGTDDPFFRVIDKFYFSVSTDSANQLKNTGGSNCVPPFDQIPKTRMNGTTILRIDWNVVSGRWGKVAVSADHDDLQLLPTQDVDALAIRTSPTSGELTYMISTQIATTPSTHPSSASQILVVFPTQPSLPLVPLRNQSGQTLPGEMRLLNSDEIDGLCGLDPEAGAVGHAIGTPLEFASPPTSYLGFGVAKSRAHRSQSWELVLHATGPYRDVSTTEIAVLAVSDNAGASFQPLAWMVRDPNASVMEFRLPAPSTFHGIELDYKVQLLDLALSPLEATYRSTIKL